MEKIKSEYVNANAIVTYFGEERIKRRLEFFLEIIEKYIKSLGEEYKEKLAVNDKVLEYCVLDYFADIKRLMEFHKIERINNIKRVAYESQWLLRRKPIQILSESDEDDVIVYANEKFVLSYLFQELLKDNEDKILSDVNKEKFRAFTESLYYHLKYRDFDAKVLELMLLSFKAGMAYNS